MGAWQRLGSSDPWVHQRLWSLPSPISSMPLHLPPLARYNIGRQQLHIIKGPVQTTGGPVVLKVPAAGSGSLQAVAARLEALLPALAGTQFAFEERRSAGGAGQQRAAAPQQPPPQQRRGADAGGGAISSIAVTCPWGQRFLLVDDAPGFPWAAGIYEVQLPCFSGGWGGGRG